MTNETEIQIIKMLDYANINVNDPARVMPFLEIIESGGLSKYLTVNAYKQLKLKCYVNSNYLEELRKESNWFELTKSCKDKIDYYMNEYKDLETYMMIDWM